MKLKLINIVICIMLIITICSPFTLAINDVKYEISHRNDDKILKLIEETNEKNLIYNDKIGDIYVQYWTHLKNDVEIKGDYILLHKNSNDEIQKFLKIWTDVEIEIPDFKQVYFNEEKILWKKLIFFSDESDCLNFYKFNMNIKYPLFCWEVRYNDGYTVLYDLDGVDIGYGTPAPSIGYSLSGYNDATIPDAWIEYRQSADNWFKKWCASTSSVSFPTPFEISSSLSDSNVHYFYELAHGDEYYFQADSEGSYYYASNLNNDMSNRQPITFAFLGSCHGMTGTGPGTFSYEFRKGGLTDTVTVGFDHMETCPGWEFGWYWQESLFENMSKGLTIRESFDSATSRYPTIEPAVVFVGDNTIKANHPPNKPSTPEGTINGESGVEYDYKSSTLDPESNQIYYLFEWGDNSDSGWIGPINSGEEVTASHSWVEDGDYEIRVKSKDINNVESEWSDPLPIKMPLRYYSYIEKIISQLFNFILKFDN